MLNVESQEKLPIAGAGRRGGGCEKGDAQEKLHSRATVFSVQEIAPTRKFVLKTLVHNCSNLSLKRGEFLRR